MRLNQRTITKWTLCHFCEGSVSLSLSTKRRSHTFTCISQSLRSRMQRFDKRYTFPSTGGDVALSRSPQSCVSDTEVHLAEAPRLPDSDECCRHATQTRRLLIWYELAVFTLFKKELIAVCHSLQSLPLTEGIRTVGAARQFTMVV